MQLFKGDTVHGVGVKVDVPVCLGLDKAVTLVREHADNAPVGTRSRRFDDATPHGAKVVELAFDDVEHLVQRISDGITGAAGTQGFTREDQHDPGLIAAPAMVDVLHHSHAPMQNILLWRIERVQTFSYPGLQIWCKIAMLGINVQFHTALLGRAARVSGTDRLCAQPVSYLWWVVLTL